MIINYHLNYVFHMVVYSFFFAVNLNFFFVWKKVYLNDFKMEVFLDYCVFSYIHKFDDKKLNIFYTEYREFYAK